MARITFNSRQLVGTALIGLAAAACTAGLEPTPDPSLELYPIPPRRAALPQPSPIRSSPIRPSPIPGLPALARAPPAAALKALLRQVTQHRREVHEFGLASWYGPGFEGRLTANGEIYDSSQMTAAHKELPLGSEVYVVNLENGREAKLRINDRGPFIGERVIDVSKAAAKALGFYYDGLAEVRIDLVRSSTARNEAPSAEADG